MQQFLPSFLAKHNALAWVKPHFHLAAVYSGLIMSEHGFLIHRYPQSCDCFLCKQHIWYISFKCFGLFWQLMCFGCQTWVIPRSPLRSDLSAKVMPPPACPCRCTDVHWVPRQGLNSMGPRCLVALLVEVVGSTKANRMAFRKTSMADSMAMTWQRFANTHVILGDSGLKPFDSCNSVSPFPCQVCNATTGALLCEERPRYGHGEDDFGESLCFLSRSHLWSVCLWDSVPSWYCHGGTPIAGWCILWKIQSIAGWFSGCSTVSPPAWLRPGYALATPCARPGYILQPPCLWGSRDFGLEDPPGVDGYVLGTVKTSNASYGHHGEMAWQQMLGISADLKGNRIPKGREELKKQGKYGLIRIVQYVYTYYTYYSYDDCYYYILLRKPAGRLGWSYFCERSEFRGSGGQSVANVQK